MTSGFDGFDHKSNPLPLSFAGITGVTAVVVDTGVEVPVTWTLLTICTESEASTAKGRPDKNIEIRMKIFIFFSILAFFN